jgi:hypothetical protein
VRCSSCSRFCTVTINSCTYVRTPRRPADSRTACSVVLCLSSPSTFFQQANSWRLRILSHTRRPSFPFRTTNNHICRRKLCILPIRQSSTYPAFAPEPNFKLLGLQQTLISETHHPANQGCQYLRNPTPTNRRPTAR